MANEISYSCSLSASKGGVDVSSTDSGSLDMSGEDMIDGSQNIATTATPINLGAISGLPAYVLIKNMDTTNFVLLSAEVNYNANSTVFAKLLPNRSMLLPPATPLFGKFDTASGKICVTAVES
jgi:hypothetical protein